MLKNPPAYGPNGSIANFAIVRLESSTIFRAGRQAPTWCSSAKMLCGYMIWNYPDNPAGAEWELPRGEMLVKAQQGSSYPTPLA